MKPSDFFKENNGQYSFVRLQSLMLTFLFMAAVCYQTYKNEFEFEVLLLLAAFCTGPKVVQKFIEDKMGKNQPA